MKKYLIDNPHRLNAISNPKENLLEFEADQMKEKLNQIKKSLTKNQVNEIVQRSKSTQSYISNPRPIDKLPFFSRKFLNKNKIFTIPDIETDEFAIFFQPTNGITSISVNIEINLAHLYSSYLPLFTSVFSKCGAAEMDDKQFALFIETYMILHTHFSLRPSLNDPNQVSGSFTLSGKIIDENIEKLFYAFEILLTQPHLDNITRISALLSQEFQAISSSIQKRGTSLSISRSRVAFNNSTALSEEMFHLKALQRLGDIVKNQQFDEISKIFQTIFKEIISLSKIKVTAHCLESSKSKIIEKIKTLLQTINTNRSIFQLNLIPKFPSFKKENIFYSFKTSSGFTTVFNTSSAIFESIESQFSITEDCSQR